MKKEFFLALTLLFTLNLGAQVIYLSTNTNDLYTLNLSNCSTQFVTSIKDVAFDISFHPNGKLYGIAGSGQFYEIDIVTGNTNNIHLFNDQLFNSLTIASDGLVYALGSKGELWSYEILNDIEVLHGDIGFGATGDLTFNNGKLYAAVSGDRIVQIDINNPANSQVVINENFAGDIYGIVSFTENCSDVFSYALTGENSNVYQIDFTTNTLAFICQLSISTGGGASTFEFYGSAPIVIDEIIEVIPGCGEDSGSISISASGGTGQIEYSIDGISFQSDGNFGNLTDGMYSIHITDDNDCDVIKEIELISNSPEITSTSISFSTCKNDNGSINVLAKDGIGPLEYSLDGLTFQSSNFFDNLQQGDYTVFVRDSLGCTSFDDVTVFSENEPEIIDVTIVDSKCTEDSGSVTAFVDGGVGQIEYSIDGINYQTENLFENLSPGMATLFILDSNSCIDSINFEVLTKAIPEITNIEIENTTCELANGLITILAIGGTGALMYSIDGINFQTDSVFNNLPSGNVEITIRDINGCSDTAVENIQSEDSPTISNVVVVNALCGIANGSITVFASGGNGPLEYSIDGTNFQSDNVFNNLASGNVEVTVQDINGCTDIEDSDIQSEDSLTVTNVVIENASCGDANGTITIFASGGTGILKYSIDGINFQTDNLFESLLFGNYLVTVRDENFCTDDRSIAIQSEDSPAMTNVVVENARCGDANGTITVLASGGTGLLEYSIDGINFQTDNLFESLLFGNYLITVRDENFCTDDRSIDIQSEDSPEITDVISENARCGNSNGRVTVETVDGTGVIMYSIDGINFQTDNYFEDLPFGELTVTVKDENNCTDELLIEILTDDTPIISNVIVADAFCDNANGSIEVIVNGGIGQITYSIDGINYQPSNRFENLPAMSFMIYIKDSNECIDSQSINIERVDLAYPNIISMHTSCGLNNGSIIIEESGVVNIMSYSIDGNNYQENTVFQNLPSGTYTVHAIDENNCTSKHDVTIFESFKLSFLNIESYPATCGADNGGFNIEIDGGTGMLEILLDGYYYDIENNFDNLGAGEYEFQVIDDAGCIIDTSVRIEHDECPIYVPNAFSPNGDNFNDEFKIFPHPDFKGEFLVFRIFSRWGELIFEAQNTNSETTSWNGTYQGEEMDTGVFAYYLEYTSKDGISTILNGSVLLLK